MKQYMRPSEIRKYERRGDGPGALQHFLIWSLSSLSLGPADMEFSLKSCFGEAFFFFNKSVHCFLCVSSFISTVVWFQSVNGTAVCKLRATDSLQGIIVLGYPIS